MKYTKLFDTHINYSSYINGDDKLLPNISYCKDLKETHYNVETRVVAKFNVTSINTVTKLTSATEQFNKIWIDDVLQDSVLSEYTFSTTGEHIVKYELANSTTLGNKSFESCSSLISIIVPAGVTTIGQDTFEACNYMTSVNLPDSLISIGQDAFKSCSRLVSIVIPKNVTTIGSYSFYNSPQLRSITFKSVNPPTLGGNSFESNNANRKIYVPAQSVDKYKTANVWSSYANAIEPIT